MTWIDLFADWDFGYIANLGFDDTPFYTDLVLLLKTDNVDLVNLASNEKY